MKKYEFEKMGAIWSEYAQTITSEGVFIAHSGNWDMWELCGMVYSIPVAGSGAGASVWCAVSHFRAHLHRLRNVCGHESLIPGDWENVNLEYLNSLGIN